MTGRSPELARKLRGYLDLVSNQRAKRIGVNEVHLERMETDFLLKLCAKYLGPYYTLEVDRNEPGEVYVCVYIDGLAPKIFDPARKDNKYTLCAGRSYNEITEQLEYLQRNDMIPKRLSR